MNVTKPRVSGSVLAAILLALIGGLVVAYLAYYLHVATPDSPLDAVRSTYPR